MPRYNKQDIKAAKAKRANALARIELREKRVKPEPLDVGTLEAARAAGLVRVIPAKRSRKP
jgi:hypothetical protein